MKDLWLLLAWLAAPVAIYVLARVIFIAYFRSKADYNRRLFNNGTDQGKDGL